MSTRDIIQAAAGAAEPPLEPPFSLYSWGSVGFGITGNGMATVQVLPGEVSGGGAWASVDLAANTSGGIKTNGTLWSWGRNDRGQLGLGDTNNRSSPVQVGALSNWSLVRVGIENRYAIKTDGTLWSWGRNQSGELGLGDVVSRSSPVQVGALSNWAQVANGFNYSLAVKTDGTLWFLGGIAGFGSSGLNIGGIVSRSSPVQIGSDSNWRFVAIQGTDVSLAVKTNNTLWTWGRGQNGGALGHNDQINRSTPTQVGGLTNWSRASGLGTLCCIALKTDGTLWSWGRNNQFASQGQLGLGDLIWRSSPVQIGTLSNWALNAGDSENVPNIRKTDGTLWTWGAFGTPTFNAEGQLGTGLLNIGYSSPIQVGTESDWAFTVGGSFHKLAITSNGSLYGWGRGGSGELGNNKTTGSYSSPVQVGASDWLNVSFGGNFALGVKDTNTLWAWGLGTSGQLANNRLLDAVSTPAQVGSSTDWATVSAGFSYGLAVKTSGSLWAWGSNETGQLGLNDTTNRSSPVQIGALSDWSQVSVSKGDDSNFSVLVIKTNGTLWAWGQNSQGQLGINSTTSMSSPVQVGALSNWAQVSVGLLCCMAVKTDGTLWAWGDSSDGRIPTNGLSYSSPVQIGSSVDWETVSVSGNAHGMAIKTSGSLWAWGRNSQGQLGLNDTTNRSSPVQVGTLSNWYRVSCYGGSGGNATTVATKKNKTMWGWGTGSINALNSSTNVSSPVQIGSLTIWAFPPPSGLNTAGGFSE